MRRSTCAPYALTRFTHPPVQYAYQCLHMHASDCTSTCMYFMYISLYRRIDSNLRIVRGGVCLRCCTYTNSNRRMDTNSLIVTVAAEKAAWFVDQHLVELCAHLPISDLQLPLDGADNAFDCTLGTFPTFSGSASLNRDLFRLLARLAFGMCSFLRLSFNSEINVDLRWVELPATTNLTIDHSLRALAYS